MGVDPSWDKAGQLNQLADKVEAGQLVVNERLSLCPTEGGGRCCVFGLVEGLLFSVQGLGLMMLGLGFQGLFRVWG